MKRVQYKSYGGPDVMSIGDYKVPALQPDQVLVSVRAAALNPLDWKQRQGAMKLFMGKAFPKGMGSDFAGVIEAVGTSVSHVQIGDEVFGTMDVRQPGAFAEALVTQSSYVVKKPSQISFAEAACLPIPAATAWAALLTQSNVSKNSHILINGCTGAVGSMAVQLALAHRAKVSGTCSPASKPEARRMGVETVFDYADEEVWRSVGPFDIIFDTAGSLSIARGLALLKSGGRFIDINPTPGRMLRGMLSRRYKVAFATMGTRHLPEIAELAANGTLKVAIGIESPFSEALVAIAAAETGRRKPGRVVLTF